MLVFLGVLQVTFFMDLDINDIAEGLKQLHKNHPDYEHLELVFDFQNICYKLYGQRKI